MTRAPGNAALTPFGTTIFATMSALAVEHDAINLGQGFPDTDGPSEVLEAAVAAIRGGANQYPPGAGVPELLDAIAAHQARFWGVSVDPRTEVLVTVGATEAIASAVLALCSPGDEVVIRGIPADRLYLSIERNMKCGLGLCGHCQWGSHFICKDGPVFPYSQIAPLLDRYEL